MSKSHRCLDHVCSAAEAAAILGVTPERVMHFCRVGRLDARQIGGVWAIGTEGLKAFAKEKRKPGRPKE